MPGCLRVIEAWHLRGRTLQAMVLLCLARLLIQMLPFRWWRGTLGSLAHRAGEPSCADSQPGPDGSLLAAPETGPAHAARRLAVHVERAAARLPFATKCLPRAMALGWLLRRAGIGYALKFAARPTTGPQATTGRQATTGDQATAGGPAPLGLQNDSLHAWVEVGEITVIGALPGPWLVVLTLRG